MKKICIVTITRGSNFGNRLQNFALQEILKQLGYQVDTVRNLTGENLFFVKFPLFCRLLEAMSSNPIIYFLLEKSIKNGKVRKKIKFILFNKRYISWSKYSISARHISESFSKSYNAYVCGSDQIWNPNMKFHSEIDYLTFVKSGRKLSYAASFGIDSLTKEQLEHLRNSLQNFDGISVREECGLEILQQAGIRNGVLVLDPTLLLPASSWEQFEQKPAFQLDEGMYIFYYNLKMRSEETDAFVRRLSKMNQWKIIDVMNPQDSLYYGIDPFEFIYLIHHAAYICTDSFHASVFSLLYHKQFIVFDRKNMNSRIDTLLKIGDMDDRKFSGSYNNPLEESRYDMFEQNLQILRSASIRFLKDVLGRTGEEDASDQKKV